MKRKTRIKKRMKKQFLLWVLIVGMLGLAACKPANEKEGTPLILAGEETIYLEEAVFYTRMLQESWEAAYYADYGETMWQEMVNEEIGTLGDALKRDVLNALTEIHLLCAHAEEYGVELTEDEMTVIAERSRKFMEGNTPEVLAAAGATEELVQQFLMRNELAAKTAEAIQLAYEPELEEEKIRVGVLTYALFATTGTFDAEGNQTPYTEEELREVYERAEAFRKLTLEMGDISLAGEAAPHTVIDVYFNESTDGGAHELVAQTARELALGEVSELLETEEGYYVVQRVSLYDEAATEENRTQQTEQERASYLEQLVENWKETAKPELDEALWDTVSVDTMLTKPELMEP